MSSATSMDSGQTLDAQISEGAFIAFESISKFYGFTGCNRFFGNYSIQQTRITTTHVGATKRLCDGHSNALEEILLNTLNEDPRIEVTKTVMKILGESHSLTFSRQSDGTTSISTKQY